jgi:hypothetical protein
MKLVLLLLLITLSCNGQKLLHDNYFKHYAAGFGTALIVGDIADAFLKHKPKELHWKTVLVGGCAGITIGGAKELIYDKWMHKGTPDWDDFIVTCLGACGGSFVLIIRSDQQRRKLHPELYE